MSKLVSPIRIGAVDLSHRVVLAPLTRMRADMPGNVPSNLMTRYYEQRASEGGLMITEATFISPAGNGGYASPGIFNRRTIGGLAESHRRGPRKRRQDFAPALACRPAIAR